MNKGSGQTAWTTKSLPSADSGLYVQNPNTTNGTYASLGVITKNSSSTDQSFSIVAESLAGGHRPNVYLSQRSDANEQTSAITIDSAGAVYINHDGTAKLTSRASGVTVAGTGTANAGALKVNVTSSGNFQHSQENFIAALGTNETNVVAIGKQGSTKNSGIVGYKFSGTAASDNNLLTFGHWGANDLLTINGAGNATIAGSVSDSKGNLRNIPPNVQSSAYTLVSGDAGKHILAGGDITIPASVYSIGDAITVINNSGSSISLIPTSGQTVYNSADGNSSGNRTLAGRGMCTLLYAGSNVYYISGAGLT